MRRLVLATLLAAASAAHAQAVGPDNGFFRPTPGNDPSLTNFLVPIQPAQPQSQPFLQPPPQPYVTLPQPVVQPLPQAVVQPLAPPQAMVQPLPAQANAVVVPVPQAAAPVQVVEEQVDRAIREAEEAKARAAVQNPAPIVGAFTGQTNERDR